MSLELGSFVEVDFEFGGYRLKLDYDFETR